MKLHLGIPVTISNAEDSAMSVTGLCKEEFEREQNKVLIQRYFSAYDTGNQDAVLRFVDEKDHGGMG